MHNFSEIRYVNNQDKTQPHRVCLNCGKVMFEGEDHFFNMLCPKESQKREHQREILENKYHYENT